MTSMKNRDINAAVNILLITYSLRDFGVMPYVFRKDVNLRCNAAYHARLYSYEGEQLNEDGQFMKFKREEMVDSAIIDGVF